MTDAPTMPIPTIRLTRETALRIRRQGRSDTARQRDLDLVIRGGVRNRDHALRIAARMSARGLEQTTTEAWAVCLLMKRYGITSRTIREEQRRAPGSV